MMQYRELGQSGIRASVIGLGAWAIGGWMWGGTDSENSIAAIRRAVDCGVNLIDTAPIYGFGLSEEIVGRAIRGMRDRVVLATKCGLVWDREDGVFHFASDEKSIQTEGGNYKVYKYLGGDSIRLEVERSLKRLDTDYIDLYQTHWQDESTPIEETMGALLKLKEEGKIRAIGVSNATIEQIERYRTLGPVDTDQELFNMLDRKQEPEKMPYCAQHNIAFLAYSPLARGLLSGKVAPGREFNPGDARAHQPRFAVENRRRAQAMLQQLQPVADRHQADFAQLAASWAFHQPGCSHVLCGARNPRQAASNAEAGAIRLSREDIQEMEAIISRFRDVV